MQVRVFVVTFAILALLVLAFGVPYHNVHGRFNMGGTAFGNALVPPGNGTVKTGVLLLELFAAALVAGLAAAFWPQKKGD